MSCAIFRNSSAVFPDAFPVASSCARTFDIATSACLNSSMEPAPNSFNAPNAATIPPVRRPPVIRSPRPRNFFDSPSTFSGIRPTVVRSSSALFFSWFNASTPAPVWRSSWVIFSKAADSLLISSRNAAARCLASA